MRADRRLGRGMRAILARSDCIVSAASLWEMLLKNSRGKLPLPEGSLGDAMEEQGFPVLAVNARHVEGTRRFDPAIADPFDRLLVATAAEEGMVLLTQDAGILEIARRIPLPVAEVKT
jgi:PIN domain nuclease of toxin-antitoxin system